MAACENQALGYGKTDYTVADLSGIAQMLTMLPELLSFGLNSATFFKRTDVIASHCKQAGVAYQILGQGKYTMAEGGDVNKMPGHYCSTAVWGSRWQRAFRRYSRWESNLCELEADHRHAW